MNLFLWQQGQAADAKNEPAGKSRPVLSNGANVKTEEHLSKRVSKRVKRKRAAEEEEEKEANKSGEKKKGADTPTYSDQLLTLCRGTPELCA